MRLRLLSGVALLTLLGHLPVAPVATASSDTALWPVLSHPHAVPRPLTRLQRRALRPIERASEAVLRTHRRCRSRSVPSSRTHDAPSAELRSLLGVLRQPPAAGDRIPPTVVRELDGVGVYVDWVRVARDRRGHEFYVYASRALGGIAYGPPTCAVLERRRLRALLAGEPRRVARLALRMQARLARWRYPARPQPSTEAVALFERRGDGDIVGRGVQYGNGIAALRIEGVWLSSARGRRMTVLLPDGVATITVTFPQIGRRPPHGERRVYPSRIERTVPVVENLATFTSPRRGWDTYPRRVKWRAVDGSVIRTTPPPPLWWAF